MLSDLSLNVAYRTGRHDLVADFYQPCLRQTVLYRRAVGYFSSYGLASAAAGIAAMVVNGGRIQLIASPKLSENDVDAIKRGYADRTGVIADACARELNDVRDQLTKDRLSALSWLISKQLLDVKLAIRVADGGAPARGIYHEKIGIFEDLAGNRVAFSGSSNETQGGLIDNFETIDVFWSWDDPHKRVNGKLKDFEEMWTNETPELEIIKFAEVTEKILAAFRSRDEPDWEALAGAVPTRRSKSATDKWRHQDKAVAKFLAEERGLLEMATGTGKTRTALRICEVLLQRAEVETVIVSMDGNDLLDQWRKELAQFSSRVPMRPPVYRHYNAFRERSKFLLNPKNSILLVSRPELGPALKGLSATTLEKTILIHDEAHRVGSAGNREALGRISDAIRFRLGLSATPDREYDEDGNAFIAQHIGPTLFKFGLAEAINAGVLSPFNYFPLEYQPDADDRIAIKKLQGLKAAKQAAGEPMSDTDFFMALARVYKLSKAKLPIFEDFIENHRDLLQRCIIFVETKEYGQEVLEIVHKHRFDFHSYFTEDDSSTLRRFANGELACLLTCHRLSEGIDIRSIQTVILFSSARARLETIQRIGRCLRTDPSNPDKRANVVDFVRAQDPDDPVANADQSRRDWLDELSLISSDK